MNNGTNLIARAEALHAFMRMQPAANQARLAGTAGLSSSSDLNPANASTTANNNPRHNNHHAMTSTHPPPSSSSSPRPSSPSSAMPSSCLCFGRPSTTVTGGNTNLNTRMTGNTNSMMAARPVREYYPDNLSVQPKPHPWEDQMEWLIVACIDLLESVGLHEHNLFAVSAVDDLVRQTTVPHRMAMPSRTDPHVAAGVIKAKIRHADEPLVDRSCLRYFIDKAAGKQRQQQQEQKNQHNDDDHDSMQQQHGTTGDDDVAATQQQRDDDDNNNNQLQNTTSEGNNAAIVGASTLAVASHSANTFADSYLAATIESTNTLKGPRRAYILARLMRLLGRVSANVQQSRMNAHSLAKCVAPSMLHWDPNTNFALLMLGRITAYVMTMIEDARVFDENLCIKIDELSGSGGW